MANIAIFRINYKSDFILTLNSDAGWAIPFCIKFWTGAPSQAYFVGFDGTTYTHCAPVDGEPTKLRVQFDDHHLPIGDLKFQIAYHFTVADFPNDTEDEVINPANITIEIDGQEYQVMLDFTGETAPEIQFSLPAYANEAQRIANEQQRIAAEQTRIDNETQRIQNEETRINQEQTRQDNEAQRIRNEQTRINQEEARVREFATLKHYAQEATTAANDAAVLANQKAQLAADKAQLAADKAALAQDAANLANQKAQLAAGKAALANDAAALANEKAALAQQKAEYAKDQGDYAKQQGDYAKEQGDYAKRKGDDAAAQMQQQAQAFSEAQSARQTAYEQAEGTESGSVAGDGSRWGAFKTNEAARDAKVDAKVADITNLQESVAEGAVYDISANNSGATYADLTAALGPSGANIPEALRRGGMSVKFVQSSDNKYVRCNLLADEFSTDVEDWEHAASVEDLENGNIIPAMAETLEPWADQKAIATPDTYTDAVRTTGGDIPVETSAGSKPESIKPVAGSKWTAKMLFNGSYNMLNAAKWGAANSQPYVGGVGNDFVYFLVPELTLGTFGTADKNNGLLFTNAQGENVQPSSVYYKPLGTTVPQSLTDGTSITPTSVSYDGSTYKDYATDGAGWLIIPKTYYDNDVCAHIAWEDWYDKHVSLDAPNTNPEAVVGVLMLEGLLALAHSDKYLRGINEEVCDNAVFGDTSSTITHMVDELSVAANAWTNAATGESDSHGNALYRHSATVSLIKQGGAACVEGEDGGIPLTVNGTTVSYIDTNATAPASVVFYEVVSTSTTKAYTDSIFSGSNINTETGVLPINDCSIEAQVAMDGKADITVKYAKNIVDQVAINATVDVPQIKRQVEDHEERIEELEETAVRTGSYDASVSVGLADNLRGDTIVDAEFYKRKTGGTQSVGSGIAAIKEVRGKSIVWNQLYDKPNNGYQINGGGTSTKVINEDEIVINTTKSSWRLVPTSNNKNPNVSNFMTVGHRYVFFVDIKSQDGGENLSIGICSSSGSPRPSFYEDIIITNNYVRYFFKLPAWTNNGLYSDCPVVFSHGETVAQNISCKNFALFDLTLIFGAGNEPTTAEFEKMFPLDYYDYNAGEVIPFAGQNLTTTGKNQYNPATGKANLIGGQTYQIGGTYTSAEIDGVAVTLDSNNCFTTTKDCVLDVEGGNDTDTIVALYNGENSAYEPYEKHTLPLDPSQWRDKQGNLVFPYGGMFGYGSAYDYAKVDADGYIRNAMRVYERRAYESGDVTSGNIITDGRTYTFYPLTEPIEVELATPVYAKYLCDKDGTEEITPANGSTPYTTMANLSILYAMDARGEIKNLPKNYLSKESAENMLNAMVSAGVIASYTMTWDAANNRYAFVITAPVEPEENTQS